VLGFSNGADRGGVEGECGKDATRVGLEGGGGQAGGFAGEGHFFDASAPGVDVSGLEASGSEKGVAGLGGMGPEEGFGREVVGEFAFVPQREPRVVNAALDVDSAAVGFVDEGVQERFAKSLAWIGRGLVAMEAFEADGFDEKFAVEAFEDFGQGVDEIVFDDLVEAEVGVVVHKTAETNAHARVEAEGVFSEKDDGGALEAAMLGEAEFFEEFRNGGACGVREAVGLAGIGKETLDGGGVDVVERGAVFDDGIPSEAGAVEEKLVEGGALDFLGHAAVAEVIAATERNGDGGCGDADVDRVATGFGVEVDDWCDAEDLRDFLRKLFEESLRIGQAYYSPGIIVAEEQATALGIRQAAEDLQVVIVPGGFPFDDLVFGHGWGS
jgi:hypothetical protein